MDKGEGRVESQEKHVKEKGPTIWKGGAREVTSRGRDTGGDSTRGEVHT